MHIVPDRNLGGRSAVPDCRSKGLPSFAGTAGRQAPSDKLSPPCSSSQDLTWPLPISGIPEHRTEDGDVGSRPERPDYAMPLVRPAVRSDAGACRPRECRCHVEKGAKVPGVWEKNGINTLLSLANKGIGRKDRLGTKRGDASRRSEKATRNTSMLERADADEQIKMMELQRGTTWTTTSTAIITGHSITPPKCVPLPCPLSLQPKARKGTNTQIFILLCSIHQINPPSVFSLHTRLSSFFINTTHWYSTPQKQDTKQSPCTPSPMHRSSSLKVQCPSTRKKTNKEKPHTRAS